MLGGLRKEAAGGVGFIIESANFIKAMKNLSQTMTNFKDLHVKHIALRLNGIPRAKLPVDAGKFNKVLNDYQKPNGFWDINGVDDNTFIAVWKSFQSKFGGRVANTKIWFYAYQSSLDDQQGYGRAGPIEGTVKYYVDDFIPLCNFAKEFSKKLGRPIGIATDLQDCTLTNWGQAMTLWNLMGEINERQSEIPVNIALVTGPVVINNDYKAKIEKFFGNGNMCIAQCYDFKEPPFLINPKTAKPGTTAILNYFETVYKQLFNPDLDLMRHENFGKAFSIARGSEGDSTRDATFAGGCLPEEKCPKDCCLARLGADGVSGSIADVIGALLRRKQSDNFWIWVPTELADTRSWLRRN
jgi:hypothetical protein